MGPPTDPGPSGSARVSKWSVLVRSHVEEEQTCKMGRHKSLLLDQADYLSSLKKLLV
ncbi:unnamed protein product [Staurois parvus]|uniref:Uncharacterized protein n=1 Tax=Staurois parvus TaxID=386267 RepID=A0ABN9DJH2_9NEOB|nr:unnamed protein product [Staurois parvus]